MSNVDYFGIVSDDRAVLAHLSDMGNMLKKLKEKQDAAEAAFDAAKKEYLHYANVIIPAEMHSCGVEAVTLSTGGTLKLKHNYYCQPNKNATDRKTICDWLKKHSGEHIIERKVVTSENAMDVLDSNNIGYIEDVSVNTQKLKSFLKDGLGVSSGMQQFTIDDIPSCIHFSDITIAEVSFN